MKRGPYKTREGEPVRLGREAQMEPVKLGTEGACKSREIAKLKG